MRKHIGVISSYITFFILSLVWLAFYWGDIGVVPIEQKLFFSSRGWLIPLMTSGFILAFVLIPASMWYTRNESTMTTEDYNDAGLVYLIPGLIVLVCTIGEPAQTFFYALGLAYLQILSVLFWLISLSIVAIGIAFELGMFKPKTKAQQNVSDT